MLKGKRAAYRVIGRGAASVDTAKGPAAMAPTTYWAYLFHQPDADPAARAEFDSGGQRTALIPVGSTDQAEEVVKQLLEEGVQLIELCGGFGVTDAARIVTLVAGRVPVGLVSFGNDSVTQAAAYKAQFD